MSESAKAIERTMALSCEYGDDVSFDVVRHELHQVAVAIQPVKPSRLFLELWLQIDADGEPAYADRSVRDFGILSGPEPYLQYQQHNTVEEVDLKRALGLLPHAGAADSPGNDLILPGVYRAAG
jgi:hypothetical protein